jgi:hypothetical protein
MLTKIPLLDGAQCERITRDVCHTRPHWIPRGPEPAAFYTLGVASYQDLSDGATGVPRRDYYQNAPHFNALLLDRFSWLHQRLQLALDTLLGTTVFAPRLGLPGFHVFDYAAIPTTDVASIHFDLQYQLIDWNDGGPVPDFANPISFTLPIKLPRGGGGLNCWDLTYEQMTRGGYHDIPTAIRQKTKTFHRYSLGELVVHSGHQLHQIAGIPDVRPGNQRITLQGHGLRRGVNWHLYW